MAKSAYSKLELSPFNKRNIYWVLTPDEVLWKNFYYDLTNTEFMTAHGYSQIHQLRTICFQRAFEVFGMADTLEKSFPGFVNKILLDFEKLIFLTDKNVIGYILMHSENFTFQLWRMCLNIGDYFMQHRVFVLTCYLMHLTSMDRVLEETVQLKIFGKVFAEHLLPCLPTNSTIHTQMERSRQFLNLLNMSRMHSTKVLSISALEFTWGAKTFFQSKLQERVWIDFNFHDPYVSVWCLHVDANVSSEVNMIFRVKKLILGRFSSILTLVAMPPVKVRIFAGTHEMSAYEDIFTFRLTESGYRLAQYCITKIEQIQITENMVKKIF